MKWPPVQLSLGIADVIRGVTFSQGDSIHEDREGYLPILRAGNIGVRLETERDLVWVPERFVSERQRLRKHDILMCTSSGSALVVGKTAFAENDFTGSWGAFNAVLRPTSAIVPKFLFYWLQSGDFRAWRDRMAKGANIQNIRNSDLMNLAIPLPAKREQFRVVELLDEAYGLRRVRSEADVKSARILPALFLKMFGDAATNPMGWPVSTIGDITGLVTSGSTPRGGAEVYVTEGPYLIRSQNVVMNHLRLSDAARITEETHQQMARTWVQEGDVLLNITGASIGRVARVKELEGPANVNQHVCIIRPNRAQVDPSFLSVGLSLPSMQSVINGIQTGASRQALNHVQVRSIKMPVPPIAAQSKFRLQVEMLEDCIEQIDAASRKLDHLWMVVMQRAFSGQLTSKWREAHMKEIIIEMSQQARALNLKLPKVMEAI
jgi:type I restriction enzyme S subunit